jgi:CheY-like chemotaxis protein
MRKLKPTVLVVDDEEGLREFAATVLAEFGFGVLTAANGEEALRILEGDFLRIDILFSDIMMPGALDGFALARRARTVRPDLRIVLASGYVDPGLASTLAEGYHRILPKPYLAHQLFEALAGELRHTSVAAQIGMAGEPRPSERVMALPGGKAPSTLRGERAPGDGDGRRHLGPSSAAPEAGSGGADHGINL